MSSPFLSLTLHFPRTPFQSVFLTGAFGEFRCIRKGSKGLEIFIFIAEMLYSSAEATQRPWVRVPLKPHKSFFFPATSQSLKLRLQVRWSDFHRICTSTVHTFSF